MQTATEIRIYAWAAKSQIPAHAVDQVIAYATAHRAWIDRYGIPTPAEGLPVATPARRIRTGRLTAAAEWNIINRYINPPLPDGLPVEAYYRAVRIGSNVQQTAAWVIVDRSGHQVSTGRLDETGNPTDTFGSCIDAMHYIDGLSEGRNS